MDNAEPSTNGVSACNLFRLGSLLSDEYYKSEAKRTMEAFEAEMLQYPWLFASFLTGVVAGEVPVLRSVRIGAKKGGSAEADVSDSATEAIHALRLGAAKAMQADAAVSAAAAAKAEPELAEKAVEKVGGADADDDESEAKVMAKPRGALETTVYLDETHGLWLRERDPDLKVRPKETERKVIPMHCPWRASD